jgi:hypothetical protein
MQAEKRLSTRKNRGKPGKIASDPRFARVFGDSAAPMPAKPRFFRSRKATRPELRAVPWSRPIFSAAKRRRGATGRNAARFDLIYPKLD